VLCYAVKVTAILVENVLRITGFPKTECREYRVAISILNAMGWNPMGHMKSRILEPMANISLL